MGQGTLIDASIGSSGSGGIEEPTFTSGIDTLIYDDDLDTFSTLATRHASAGHSTGNPPFFCAGNAGDSNLSIISPGRGGGGFAARTHYVNNSQEARFWTLWPNGDSKYTPTTARIVIQIWIRVTAGWNPGSAGFKWMEFWLLGGPGRLQTSVFGSADPWVAQWSSHPSGPPASNPFAFQPFIGEPVFADIANGDWFRHTWEFQAASELNANDGLFRYFVNGTRVIDVSAQGVIDGYCTSAERTYLPPYAISYFQGPDVLVGAGSGPFNIDYDDVMFWVEAQ